MLIGEIMTDEYESISRSRRLKTAVGVMLKNGTEFVILTDESEPDGIITRRSALIACYKTDEPLSEIPVSGFASGFPTTVEPDSTVLFAIGLLVSNDAEVLPVVDGLELVGIVTREILLEKYSNLRNEAFANIERRIEWEET